MILSDIICDSTFANVNTTTSSITTRFLVAMLDDAKIGVDDVLLAAGVTRDALSSPDCRMPLDLFRELCRAASPGRFYNDRIKGHFACHEVNPRKRYRPD